MLASTVIAAEAPKAPADPLPLVSYASPGQLVKLSGGNNLNIRCIGQGSPTIVLTAGAGEQTLTWRALQSSLSTMARVCAWDRPGFGFSDPIPTLDATHLTDSLEAGVVAARIMPPYLLVGHSLGSFETLMFAFRHPDQVAGIVLIDPAGPFQDARLRRAAPATYAAIDALQTSQVTALKQGKTASDRANFSLLTNMFSGVDSRELMQAWHPLGALPLIVLTAGEPPAIPVSGAAKAQMPALQAAWSDMHDEMARLSTRGTNRLVPQATHNIYLDRPDVVTGAIGEVLGAYRAKADAPRR